LLNARIARNIQSICTSSAAELSIDLLNVGNISSSEATNIAITEDVQTVSTRAAVNRVTSCQRVVAVLLCRNERVVAASTNKGISACSERRFICQLSI
tara:strand:- start:1873 stop:2166 length:294 start_codon:yes stop_codon:yes gene_type:complete